MNITGRDKPMTDRDLRMAHGALAVEHSNRFRRVADRYPRRVAEAYGGDIARAAADDDATVAANVRGWEIANGLEPRDWPAWGREHDGKG